MGTCNDERELIELSLHEFIAFKKGIRQERYEELAVFGVILMVAVMWYSPLVLALLGTD